jgi:hypothetical protein
MQHSPICASAAIRSTQPSPAPGPHPSSLAIIYSHGTNSLSQSYISSQLAIWTIYMDPLILARFLHPPYRRTQKAQAYRWQNTCSPYSSKITTLWKLLLLICKTKHEHLVISEKMIGLKDRPRRPHQFFPPFLYQPLLTGLLTW